MNVGVLRAVGAHRNSKRVDFSPKWCNAIFQATLGKALCVESITRGRHSEKRRLSVALPGRSTTWRSIYARVLQHSIYVPEGCAHGFLTLEDETEVFYQMSEFYSPDAAQGVRWNDPAFQIRWPEKVEIISERDRTYPDFESS